MIKYKKKNKYLQNLNMITFRHQMMNRKITNKIIFNILIQKKNHNN